MTYDRVRPLKYESPSTGGTQDDEYPTGQNPNQDHPDSRGYFAQDDTSDDEDVHITRNDAGQWVAKDKVNTEYVPLIGGGGITEAAHKILRQLIHFLGDGGPGPGFSTGDPYYEVAGSYLYPDSETWYEDSTKAKKIIEKLLTWDGPKLTQRVWNLYDSGGVSILATATDTIVYEGMFQRSSTRSFS